MKISRSKTHVRILIPLLLALVIFAAAGCSGAGGFRREVNGLNINASGAAAKIEDAREYYDSLPSGEKKKAAKALGLLNEKDAQFFGLLVAKADRLSEEAAASGTPAAKDAGLYALRYAEGHYLKMPPAARAIAAENKTELSLIASEYYFTYVDAVTSIDDIELLEKAAAFYGERQDDAEFREFCAVGKAQYDIWMGERGEVTAEVSEFLSCAEELQARLVTDLFEQNYDILYALLTGAREFYGTMSEAAKNKCAAVYDYIFAPAEDRAGAEWRIYFEAERYASKLFLDRKDADFERLDLLTEELDGAGQIVDGTLIFGRPCRAWLEETYGQRFCTFVEGINPIPDFEDDIIFAENLYVRFGGSPDFTAAADRRLQMLRDKRAVMDSIKAERDFPVRIEEFRQKMDAVASASLTLLLADRAELLVMYGNLSDYSKQFYISHYDFLADSYALIDAEAVVRAQEYLSLLQAADTFAAAEGLEAVHSADDPIVSGKLFDGKTFTYLVTEKLAELFGRFTGALDSDPENADLFAECDSYYKKYSGRNDFKTLAAAAKAELEDKRNHLYIYQWEESEFNRLYDIFLNQIEAGNDGFDAAAAVEGYYLSMTAFSIARHEEKYTEMLDYAETGIAQYYESIAEGIYNSIQNANDLSTLDNITYELEMQREKIRNYIIYGDTLYGHIQRREERLVLPDFYRIKEMLYGIPVHSEMNDEEKQYAADLFSGAMQEYNALDPRVRQAEVDGKTLEDLFREKKAEMAAAGIIV